MKLRTYKYNNNYFDNIDSEDKAYFLGFLYADGNVTNTDKKKSIRLEIHNKDIEVLEKFKEYLNYDKPIYFYKTGMCGLEMTGKTIVTSAQKHGLEPRKTFNLNFPDFLEPVLINHFMRGFFDGDGSIYLRKDPKIKHKVAVISFTSNEIFCNKIKEILKNECGAYSKFSIRHKDRNNNIGSLVSGGNLQSQRILDYLYKNATIFLSRKHNLYRELCQINAPKL